MFRKSLFGCLLVIAMLSLPIGCSTGSPLVPGKTGLVDVTPPWLNIPLDTMDIAGDVLFMADSAFGLHMFDISNPLAPAWMNRVDIPGSVNGLTVVDGYAFIPGYGELTIIDVSPVSSAHVVSTFEITEDAWNIEVCGDYLFVVNYFEEKLEIYNIRDHANPVPVKSMDIPSRPVDIAVRGKHAFVTDRENGILVIDISNPANASVVHTVDIEDGGTTIAIVDEFALVGDYNSRLNIVDIAEPLEASPVAAFELSNNVEEILIRDGYAFVAEEYVNAG